MYWRRRLTRLELALYAGVMAVFLAVFLEQLLSTMEIAERTAMEVTVSRVNSEIQLKRAYAMLLGEAPLGVKAPAGNPFEMAGIVHPKFRGATDAPVLAEVERGAWIFDRSSGDLIYLPRLHRRLTTDDPDNAIRFRLARTPSSIAALVPTSKYTWIIE